MPVSDPIADLLTRMRNAQAARRAECRAPWSRFAEGLLRILQRDGWIACVAVEGEEPRRTLVVTFVEGKRLALRRVSKPGRRVYAKSAVLKPVQRGFGTAILTTSGGLLNDREARARRLGGEILCTIS